MSFLHGGDLIDAKNFEAVTTERKPVTKEHKGWTEHLQVSSGALLELAYDIGWGDTDAYGWDAFWSSETPVRIRLAWGDKSAAYEGLGSSDISAMLLTHLSLSIERRDSEAYRMAVTIPLNRRFADADWRIAAVDGPRKDCVYDSATPATSPGVTIVDRNAVRNALAKGRALVINALPADANGQMGLLPDSIWLSGAGKCGSLGDETDTKLAQRLKVLTGGDLSKPLIFYCAHAMCWWSYNAAQRAHHLGYKDVSWYRGGLQDWANYGDQIAVSKQDNW
jgi:PQQ-dependent catabolism-associated CXXCW motif protein